MKTVNIPSFFEDNSENMDHELMLDYFLAWTLRCAQESNEDIKIKEASQKILSHLLFSKQKEQLFEQELFLVESVKTWKQWKQIDLCVETIIKLKNGDIKKYAILIENKMYTHVHHNQLERYKNVFEEFYSNPVNEKTDYERKYIFLTCHTEINCKQDFEECAKTGFTPLGFGWLKYETNIEKTGNYMFDEFWFKYWA